MTINLYHSTLEEKLTALREGGFSRDNIASDVKIYEAIDGTLKASKFPNDVERNGRVESIGFWLWCSFHEYKTAQEGKDDIHRQIEAGFEVNLKALKDLL